MQISLDDSSILVIRRDDFFRSIGRDLSSGGFSRLVLFGIFLYLNSIRFGNCFYLYSIETAFNRIILFNFSYLNLSRNAVVRLNVILSSNRSPLRLFYPVPARFVSLVRFFDGIRLFSHFNY